MAPFKGLLTEEDVQTDPRVHQRAAAVSVCPYLRTTADQGRTHDMPATTDCSLWVMEVTHHVGSHRRWDDQTDGAGARRCRGVLDREPPSRRRAPRHCAVYAGWADARCHPAWV